MGRARITGAEYNCDRIFSKEFVFNIPLYQRPYAWSTEQAEQLLDDILEFMGDGNEPVDELNPYFLGNLVVIKPDDSPESEVVDGQQRLSTLTILLAVIRHLADPDKTGKHLANRIREDGDPLMGTEPRYRLQVRDRDNDFFKTFIQEDKGLEKLFATKIKSSEMNEARSNFMGNAKALKAKLADSTDAELARLAGFILKQVLLVVVSTPDFESAYRIFAVLNDRGLNLSFTDILKSEIIGRVDTEKQDQYTKKWEDIEDDLGRDNFADLFGHIRMINRRTKLKKTMLREVREYLNPASDPVNFIDESLIPYAEHLVTVKKALWESDAHAAEVNEVLTWLNRIDNFDWIPVAIEYLNREQDEVRVLKFFLALERLAATMMIWRENVNRRIDRYARILDRMDAKLDLFASDSPLQLSDDEKEVAIAAVNGEVYLVPKTRKYILLRLDSALSSGTAKYDYTTISIEHVLPQTRGANSEWNRLFTDQQHEQWVHRLANLILLARRKNSQASNYTFEKKKKKYFATESGSSPFALTTGVLQENEWNLDTLARRQNRLTSALIELWDLNPSEPRDRK